ncbi:MAG TPA: fatty acid desaturase [Rhizomicrobium sp.]|nr:fatty acid desaturase [Rhizomicrobium sp.]
MQQSSLSVSHQVSECSLPHIHFTGNDGGFRRALTARVEAYLAATGKGRGADTALALKAVFYAAAMIGLYAMMLAGGSVWWKTGLLSIGYGVSALLLAINIGHDAAHVAVTGNRRIDSAIHRLVFVPIGVDGYLWQMRHLGSHHVFPNVNGCDIDIDENPFLRLSPNHAPKPWQRAQHLFAVPVYMLTLLHSAFWGDFAYLRKRSLANMRNIAHRRRDVALFFAAKFAYVAINIAVPMLVLPFAWWQVLLGYLAMTAVMSLLFIFLLVGTHFSDGAAFPKPGADGTIAMSWAEHAVATSVDWAPESRIAGLIAGGANAHAAHHLFPRLSHTHGAAVTRIVRETAREFGVAYHETSFSGMVRGHFRHLKALGQGDPDREGERDDPDRGVHLAPAA